MATKEEIVEFLTLVFPQARARVLEVGDMGSKVIQIIGHDELRPGGTVSGPILMATADLALYVAILGEIGIVPLAVTTSLTINFLRRPSGEHNVVGVCKLLKVGKTLAMGEVHLYSEGQSEPVAHVVGTYSLPPR